MKKKWFILSMFFVLLVGGVILAKQQGEGWHGNRGIWKALDLSNEQQKKLLDMRLELQKEMLPLRSDMQKLRSELKLELTKAKFDESRAKKLSEQIASIGQQIQLKRILHQRAVRDILSPEQQKIYDLHLLSAGKFRGRERPRSPAGPESPRPPAKPFRDTDQ